jgi:hypothetical protein
MAAAAPAGPEQPGGSQQRGAFVVFGRERLPLGLDAVAREPAAQRQRRRTDAGQAATLAIEHPHDGRLCQQRQRSLHRLRGFAGAVPCDDDAPGLQRVAADVGHQQHRRGAGEQRARDIVDTGRGIRIADLQFADHEVGQPRALGQRLRGDAAHHFPFALDARASALLQPPVASGQRRQFLGGQHVDHVRYRHQRREHRDHLQPGDEGDLALGQRQRRTRPRRVVRGPADVDDDVQHDLSRTGRDGRARWHALADGAARF